MVSNYQAKANNSLLALSCDDAYEMDGLVGKTFDKGK